jgi:predicted SpoU family rRNA methylase
VVGGRWEQPIIQLSRIVIPSEASDKVIKGVTARVGSFGSPFGVTSTTTSNSYLRTMNTYLLSMELSILWTMCALKSSMVY